jgi:Protein of unknown function (DUF4231)
VDEMHDYFVSGHDTGHGGLDCNSPRHEIAMGLGVLITIIESFLQLSQSQQHWISYRATAEGLKHEKYLYLGQAGRYSDPSNRQALLADKVETLISSENTNWIDTGNQGGAKSAKAGA